MRSFIKNNLVSLIVFTFVFSGLSFASVITRPYTSADYAGGTKAVGAKVNDEFQSIVNWLNGGNISSDNIAAFGVQAINLASNSVTTLKISDGSVTNVKRGASNIAVTQGSSLYSNTGTFAVATNLSTTITTLGRPVLVRLEPANTPYLSGGNSFVVGAVYSNDSGGLGSFLTIRRDSGTLAQQPIPYSGASFERLTPCSAYSYVDNVAAGTYTYQAGAGSNPAVTAIISGCRLNVTEF